MNDPRPKPGPGVPAAQIAKQALRRLALSKQEPTPENYARAYAAEAQEAGAPLPEPALPERALAPLNRLVQLGTGDATERQALLQAWQGARWDEALRLAERLLTRGGPNAQGETLAQAIEQLVRGLERGGRQWTLARKKDGLSRVLGANRGDGARLVARLRQLVASWDSDGEAGVEGRPVEDEDRAGTPSQFFDETEALATPPAPVETMPLLRLDEQPLHWHDIAAELHATTQVALQPAEAEASAQRARTLMQQLEAEHARAQEGDAGSARAEAVSRLGEQARRLLAHRRHVMEQLGGLCEQLSGSLIDLSEDESWAQGQAAVMRDALAQGLSATTVRSVSERLARTREQQRGLREQRRDARDALRGLVQTLLAELASLGQHTDRFGERLGRYAEVVGQADSLESLTGLVREMVQETQAVQGLVQATRGRLHSEHERATALAERVNSLEGELRRLAEEVQTDQLTQVANRRGLQIAFEAECKRQARDGGTLAVALLDIDNFKKLNDSLGHAAGDEALKGLAARTQSILRPVDRVARYGGEEFVLLLPDTPLDEARQVLGRLQRALSASLFMHEGRDVFVTFSAGVTLLREGEALDSALERADEALYEAKRTGKNRTCVA
ncbi:MAG: diguanylate cyclase [Burkholderiales bacterium]|nr:diguanylate cyclase [Burkholderiales bacterium]